MRITKDNTTEVIATSSSALASILRVLALEVAVEAKKIVPVKTGRLRRSIHARVPDDVTAKIGSSVHYAPYVEMGTEPHVIVPRKAKALRFVVDGKVVFAKRVQHPGTKPRPYLRPALEIVMNRWKNIGKITPGWIIFRAKSNLAQLALEVLREARRIVPVKTGALKKSLRAEIDVRTGEIAIGSPIHYAPYVEIHKPYLAPALETVMAKWIKGSISK